MRKNVCAITIVGTVLKYRISNVTKLEEFKGGFPTGRRVHNPRSEILYNCDAEMRWI